MAVDRIVWKILLDILVLLCVGGPLLVFWVWVEPYQRGFFENDLSIKLPYRPQSVSEALQAGVGFALVILTILLTEIVRDKQGKGVGEKFISKFLVPGWIWESYTAIGVFIFGAICQQLIVLITKNVIGRLRPHFYHVCMPSYNASAPLNSMGYIQDFTCLQPDESLLKDIRLSFPSAHSSFGMYCAVFFIFYVQVKGKWRGSKLLRHGIQFAVVLAAWYVGLTRVQENFHHWSDVAVGYIIGAAFGASMFVYVFKPKKYGVPGGRMSWIDREPDPQSVLPRPVLAR